MTSRLPILSVAVSVIATLTACTYQPGDVDSPLARKATWFSYLAGDDLRPNCGPGTPDKFRLIYNGNWNEQVRTYELNIDGDHVLTERVIETPPVSELSFSDPLGLWRGKKVSTVLGQAEYDRLLRDLEASGAYTSPADTLTLAADQFYWVAASCHQGVFHLTAWLYPSEAFAKASFPTWLAAVDTTGVPFNPPRPWTEIAQPPPIIAGDPPRLIHQSGPWTIGIAQDRLVGRVIF